HRDGITGAGHIDENEYRSDRPPELEASSHAETPPGYNTTWPDEAKLPPACDVQTSSRSLDANPGPASASAPSLRPRPQRVTFDPRDHRERRPRHHPWVLGHNGGEDDCRILPLIRSGIGGERQENKTELFVGGAVTGDWSRLETL